MTYKVGKLTTLQEEGGSHIDLPPGSRADIILSDCSFYPDQDVEAFLQDIKPTLDDDLFVIGVRPTYIAQPDVRIDLVLSALMADGRNIPSSLLRAAVSEFARLRAEVAQADALRKDLREAVRVLTPFAKIGELQDPDRPASRTIILVSGPAARREGVTVGEFRAAANLVAQLGGKHGA